MGCSHVGGRHYFSFFYQNIHPTRTIVVIKERKKRAMGGWKEEVIVPFNGCCCVMLCVGRQLEIISVCVCVLFFVCVCACVCFGVSCVVCVCALCVCCVCKNYRACMYRVARPIILKMGLITWSTWASSHNPDSHARQSAISFMGCQNAHYPWGRELSATDIHESIARGVCVER